MKASNSLKALALAGVFFLATKSNAQIAQASVRQTAEKQKILVDLKITPSVPGFRAGVVPFDNTKSKIKLWVCNSDEKKCTVTVYGSEGSLWRSTFRDAYYGGVLDFSLLDDGTYTIRVTNGTETIERKITIATNSYVERDFKIEEQ